MREIINQINRWQQDGNDKIAIATVIQTWGSAPRGIGAKMAMTPDHKIAGSVSGGCIEGAVFEAAMQALEEGKSQLLQFGVADETAFETIGLACGGTVEVFVEPLQPHIHQLWRDAAAGEYAVAIATVVQGAGMVGQKAIVTDTPSRQDASAATSPIGLSLQQAAQAALARGQSQRVILTATQTGLGEDLDVFVDVQLPSPTLIIIGGVHIAIALTHIAKLVGYRSIVIDPRAAFGNSLRFGHVDELVREWPREAFKHVPITRATAIVTLTHDAKFDDQALKIALPSVAFYVGALGGKSTRAKRRERLLAAGLAVEVVDRLHAPIGLDLASKTPEEIALATMAQIVAAKNK
ncbi:MAG: XdhC/CoxI family protein [Anaerolineae bacterium]|nr:XdhC/CoxI family protein [Anaerolineae bacterium]